MKTTSPASGPLVQLFRWGCFAGVFTGAFLMFQVQPLVAKSVTPWFGGVAATWSLVVLFFQVVLLAGYSFSFAVSRWPARRQAQVYLGLIALAAVAAAWVTPVYRPEWIDVDQPAPGLARTLFFHLGLPAFFLSTISTMLQSWYPLLVRRDPYPLYSLSNTGSVLALVSFPFVLEPMLTLSATYRLWQISLWLCLTLCAGVALIVIRTDPARDLPAAASTPAISAAPTWPQYAGWLILTAISSALLLSLTQFACQDLAPVPFLWIAPLTAYLLTFIICFARGSAFKAGTGVVALLIVVPVYLLLVGQGGVKAIAMVLILVFTGCLVCHAELVRHKPAPAYLTHFYLMIALGGVIGSSLVNFVAPLVFNDYAEAWLSIAACLLAAAFIVLRQPGFFGPGRLLPRAGRWVMLALAISFATLLVSTGFQKKPTTVAQFRNFYGVIDVRELDLAPASESGLDDISAHDATKPGPPLRSLVHGRTWHGSQWKTPGREMRPTVYYGPASGLALAWHYLETKGRPLKVGALGLGVGTAAAYGRPGDLFRFYEINPKMIEVAKTNFSFLGQSKATIETMAGDARLSLARSEPQAFDLILLDAFNSDSIPVHLLTREAFAIYLRHLKPDGCIAMNISNRYLALGPVLARLAEEFQLHGYEIHSPGDEAEATKAADYVVLSREAFTLDAGSTGAHILPLADTAGQRLWTDDYSNIFSVLKTSTPRPAARPAP